MSNPFVDWTLVSSRKVSVPRCRIHPDRDASHHVSVTFSGISLDVTMCAECFEEVKGVTVRPPDIGYRG